MDIDLDNENREDEVPRKGSIIKYSNVFSDIKNNCSQHKIEIAAHFDKIQTDFNNKVENLNRDVSEIKETLKRMSDIIDRIDQRMFRTNGQKALVEEVNETKADIKTVKTDIQTTATSIKSELNREIVAVKKELKDHFDLHTDHVLQKRKYIYLLVGVLLTSSFGTILTTTITKLLTPKTQPTQQVQQENVQPYTERTSNDR